MRRRLPRKRSPRQEQIIQAAQEFYGEMSSENKRKSDRLALWLMGRKRGIELTQEEQEDLWYVQRNL